MGGQDWIALGVVGAAALYAGRSLWRTLHGETGCGGDCGCARNDSAIPADRKLQHVPLVTIGGTDQIVPPPAPKDQT